MLDTAPTLPLFGGSSSSPSSSSSPMDARGPLVTIERPPSEFADSYSWSDCTIVVRDDTSQGGFGPFFSSFEPSESISSLLSVASSSSSSTLSSEASSTYDDETDAEGGTRAEEEAEATNKKICRRRPTSSSSLSTKHVRFAPSLEIRTYSVVLGDHPGCEDGLAIELGWDYEEEPRVIDLQLHEDCRRYSGSLVVAAPTTHHTMLLLPRQRRRRGWCSRNRHTSNRCSCSRRSHLERKSMLLEVAGCTVEELNERTKAMQEERNINHLLAQQQLQRRQQHQQQREGEQCTA